MKNLMRSKPVVALLAMFGVMLAGLAPAGASSVNPTTETTSLVTSAVGQIVPVVLAIATGCLVIAVLTFAIRKVYGVVRRGGSFR